MKFSSIAFTLFFFLHLLVAPIELITQNSVIEAAMIPRVSLVDIFGIPIETWEYIGRHILVMFIDYKKTNEHDALKGIIDEYGNRSDIVTIAFVSNFPQKDRGMPIRKSNVFIIEVNYAAAREQFKVPVCCNMFYLYDLSGHMIYSGNFSSDRLTNVMRRELDKSEFQIASAVKNGENIHSMSWLSQISQIIDQDKAELYLVTFLRSICTTCESGHLLANGEAENSQQAKHILVVPPSFTNNDVLNLKTNLNIRGVICIADDALNAEWNRLAAEYGIKSVSALQLLFDGKGTVLKSADPQCQCYDDIYQYISNIKRRRGT